MALDASNSRRTARPPLSPRLVGLATAVLGSATAVLLWWLVSEALGDDSLVPWLVLGPGLLIAWGIAVAFSLAAGARRRAWEALQERQRLEVELAELAERARQADSLRREVDGYRQLFDFGGLAPTAQPAAPAVPAAPIPSVRTAPMTDSTSPVPPPRPAVPTQPEPPLHESLRDPLTGLFHRRYFEASLGREIHRMERRNLTLGVLLLQVDDFDRIADIRGRESAEALLRTLADLLKCRVRGGDVASHNGGGEFGLILPEAPLEGVRNRAEQLRTAVKELRARTGDEPPASFSLSLGVAAYPESGIAFEKLLRAVKDALEQSRAEGGDRVSMAPGAVLDRRLMLPD
jgi:diguanylate cyclase (GGDEF)-like protein